jgi:uncharacterized protein (TIGR02646 family)
VRHIVKGNPPADLVATAKATTTNLTTVTGARTAFNQIDKSAARAGLAREQAQLCAFCNRRVDPEATDDIGQFTMKIAHRIPIDADPSVALTWSNLLGSCDGGQRSGTTLRTCDAAQGRTRLELDPTQTEHVAQVRFERRGSAEGLFITSTDGALRTDVEETLGLNQGDLPANREAAWKAFQIRARRAGAYDKNAKRALVERERAQAGLALPEYFGVLEAKLR